MKSILSFYHVYIVLEKVTLMILHSWSVFIFSKWANCSTSVESEAAISFVVDKIIFHKSLTLRLFIYYTFLNITTATRLFSCFLKEGKYFKRKDSEGLSCRELIL